MSLFRLSSSALFRATKNLAYIHSVAIVIPTHWEPSMCGLDNNIVTRSSFSEADIVVGKSHPVYGDRPFTEQVGGCEVPGKFIGISESFLLNLNGTSKNFGKPGKQMLAEDGGTADKLKLEAELVLHAGSLLFWDDVWFPPTRCHRRVDELKGGFAGGDLRPPVTGETGAHVFVKEWTKYRYGVFDELGYAGDLLYPAFFKAHTPDRSIDGVPTACTNSPVQGQNNCIAGKCFFRPDPSNLNLNVTSSLLSFPQLDNVDEFCDGGSHDPIPPTKHNVLCASRSVWDIITRHHDFRDVPPITGMPYTSPTFEFRKVGPRNIVFALDWTQSMGQQGRWKNVRASIYRVLELLKAGSGVKYRPIRVGIVHFTTTAREFKDLTPIENLLLSSASLVKRYPGREEMRCVTCGVRKALEILAQDNEGPITGSEIVIISQELNIGDQLNSVLQELVDKGVRVHSVVYPDSPYKEIQLVSKATGGRSATITSSAVAGDPAASTKALMDTMAAVESVTNVQRTTKIFQAMKTPSAASGVISDRFPIDSALAANKFQLLVYYSSLESGKPRSMELSSPTGQRFGDFVPSPIGYNADLITVEHQNLKNGLWSYRIEMINPIPVLVEVRAFQAEFASSPLTLSIATSWDKQEGISETERRNPAKTPLVIYGFLRRGEAPVLRAKVTAHVHITSRDEDRVVTVDLRDTGNGAPDIQSGDGIYSAHFSDFLPRKAKYSISAVAEDGGGAVYVTRRPDANDIACCGSSIGEVDTAQTGAFYRLEAGPSFFVQTPPTDDVFPPSRVTDLRAEVQQEYNYNMVSLLWTSPGGDYELGKADHYELLYSRYLDDILTRNLSSMHRITNLPRPALAGSAQEADAVVKDGRLKHGIVYYFVLRSFHGRWSEVSDSLLPR
ncbi:unnamed protein product, partial [Cyprideis torosa]